MAKGPSYFGGQYVAANFAFGCAGGPEALSVHNVPFGPSIGSPAAALATTVAFGYCTTTDGYTFYPLSTNAPINVGCSNSEKVTPTAVSAANPGYGAMNFAAVFANAHGEGDAISSATFGLQEAIDLANADGGGVVIIDNRWTALGGTTTIKNNAVFPSPTIVTILDNRT